MFGDENQDFEVVVNAEEQYSIWPSGRELPAGWDLAGFRGPKSDCLAHIDAVWTDITPLSARQAAFDPTCDIIGSSASEELADLRVLVAG